MESFPSRVAGAAEGLAGLSGAGKTCHLVVDGWRVREKVKQPGEAKTARKPLKIQVNYRFKCGHGGEEFQNTKALKKHMTSNCRVIELCWWK